MVEGVLHSVARDRPSGYSPGTTPVSRVPAIPTDTGKKDPIESVVDRVASTIGFFPDLLVPVFEEAVASSGGFGFDALEIARTAASPTPRRYVP